MFPHFSEKFYLSTGRPRLASWTPLAGPLPGAPGPAGLFARLGPLPVWVLLFGRGPETGRCPASRDPCHAPLLRESLLPLPLSGQDRGAGLRLVSGLPGTAPAAGLPIPVLIVGRPMVALVAERALLSLRGP